MVGDAPVERNPTTKGVANMAVARVTKVTSASPKSFEDAVRLGIERAAQTLRGITGLDVVSQKAKVANGKIEEYRVTMEITFILD